MRSNPVLLIIFITISTFLFKLSWALLMESLDRPFSNGLLIPYAATLTGLYLLLSWFGFLPLWAGLASFILVPAVWFGYVMYFQKEDKPKRNLAPRPESREVKQSPLISQSSASPKNVNNQTYQTRVVHPPQPNQLAAQNRITCPLCNSAMVPRTAKRGRSRGKSFYGCMNFPYCRGTRPV